MITIPNMFIAGVAEETIGDATARGGDVDSIPSSIDFAKVNGLSARSEGRLALAEALI